MAVRKNPGATPSGRATRPIQRDPLLQTAFDRIMLKLRYRSYPKPIPPHNRFVKSN